VRLAGSSCGYYNDCRTAYEPIQPSPAHYARGATTTPGGTIRGRTRRGSIVLVGGGPVVTLRAGGHYRFRISCRTQLGRTLDSCASNHHGFPDTHHHGRRDERTRYTVGQHPPPPGIHMLPTTRSNDDRLFTGGLRRTTSPSLTTGFPLTRTFYRACFFVA